MTDCPKCNAHLKITDWRPNCPHCGANIVVYDLQERLMKEADIAEVQYYHFQKKVDCIKSAFVGSKLSIVRIFTSLIPIAALFLPIVKIVLSSPFEEYNGNMGLLDIYNLFDKIDVGVFARLIQNEATFMPGIMFTVAVAGLLLSVVVMLLHFILNMFACFPHGKRRNFAGDIIFIFLIVLSMACFAFIPENSFVSGSLGIGAFIYLALAVLNFVIDILCFREKIEVKHSQCFVGGIPIEEYFEMVENGASQKELRQEMYKRLTAIQQEQERKLSETKEKKEAVHNE